MRPQSHDGELDCAVVFCLFTPSRVRPSGSAAFGKANMRSYPSSSSLPKVVHETVPMLGWLITDLSRPRTGESVTFFLHSSFLHATNTLNLWCVHIQKALSVGSVSGVVC